MLHWFFRLLLAFWFPLAETHHMTLPTKTLLDARKEVVNVSGDFSLVLYTNGALDYTQDSPTLPGVLDGYINRGVEELVGRLPEIAGPRSRVLLPVAAGTYTADLPFARVVERVGLVRTSDGQKFPLRHRTYEQLRAEYDQAFFTVTAGQPWVWTQNPPTDLAPDATLSLQSSFAIANDFTGPSDACLLNDEIYFLWPEPASTRTTIRVYSTAGVLKRSWGLAAAYGTSHYGGICTDGTRIYVTRSSNQLIESYTTQGVHGSDIDVSGQAGNPGAIAYNAGSFYVLQGSNLLRWSTAGVLLNSIVSITLGGGKVYAGTNYLYTSGLLLGVYSYSPDLTTAQFLDVFTDLASLNIATVWGMSQIGDNLYIGFTGTGGIYIAIYDAPTGTYKSLLDSTIVNSGLINVTDGTSLYSVQYQGGSVYTYTAPVNTSNNSLLFLPPADVAYSLECLVTAAPDPLMEMTDTSPILTNHFRAVIAFALAEWAKGHGNERLTSFWQQQGELTVSRIHDDVVETEINGLKDAHGLLMVDDCL